MKISYNWLKEFVETDLTPRDMATKLTMAGLAVDAVEPEGDDFILDFDLTSNRPDCLSHLGVAREVAALTGGAMRLPEVKLSEASTATAEVTSVEILAPELCPRYTARVIRGVRIGPSPRWLVERLEALGQRSVNNVADITNYVMLELGQPLHAFDLNALGGRRIVVRAARAGERMTTLDGEERAFTDRMLVIADAEHAVAIGGVKGGEDSGITESTTDVLLEAAYFTPAQIRQTARSLALGTEASYRFERGTDPEIVPFASARAAALIAEIAGGEVLQGLIDIRPLSSQPREAGMRLARYRDKTGLAIDLAEAARILTALGMQTSIDEMKEAISAVVPSWRTDIAIEEDLIEEVARISGYDKLVSTLPGSAGAGAYLPDETGRRTVRQSLTSFGFHEAVSFSFVNAEHDAIFSQSATAEARVVLNNPIDERQAQLRTSLLTGLLEAVAHNFNHGNRNVRLFEMGKCFGPSDGGERPQETERLALVMTGARNENYWQAEGERVDFADLKGALEAVVENLSLPDPEFAASAAISYLHPGRAAVISLHGSRIGHLGQLHPRTAASFKFKQPVFLAEVNMEALLTAPRSEIRYRPLPKFPTVTRDLAVMIDTQIEYAAIEAEIMALEIPELVHVRLFDIYAGRELPSGKHSLALSLKYRVADRTLTEAEINAAHERVVAMLRAKFAAEQR